MNLTKKIKLTRQKLLLPGKKGELAKIHLSQEAGWGSGASFLGWPSFRTYNEIQDHCHSNNTASITRTSVIMRLQNTQPYSSIFPDSLRHSGNMISSSSLLKKLILYTFQHLYIFYFTYKPY